MNITAIPHDAAGRQWFQYFPGNFMWSQGMMMAIEASPWGGSAFDEVHRVGKALQGSAGDNDAWHAAWHEMAQRLERMAAKAAMAGHSITATGLYRRAATYYFVGERFLPPGEGKSESYRRVLECFRKSIADETGGLEFVDIPYQGSALAAHFLPSGRARPQRTMVIFDGLDICKEIITPSAGMELAKRGIACLVVDGPGQGESLRLRGIPSRHDYEVPASACVDYLAGRHDIDPERIGVMAVSMGGYYAPRAAAFEKRFKICACWGAHFDYHAVWVRRRKIMEDGGATVSAPGFQLPWVLGVPDMDAAMEKLRNYTLDGVAEQISCPILVTHGQDDSIVPVEMAYRLYDAIGTPMKELKIFTQEDGCSEHCMEDNRQIGISYIADWISDHL